MHALRKWFRGVGEFVWKNADAFLVVLVAVGVLIAEVVGKPSTDVVDSAILGLLGVTAIVLLRDRVGRNDLDDLRQLAADSISERPYEVIWQRNEWDLQDREHSTVRTTQQVRFTRDEVSSMDHWSSGPGKIERYAAKWRRHDGGQWIIAQKIHEFPVHNGQRVTYSFDEEHNRGDMLEWSIERDAVGRFPSSHEGVALEASTKANHPRIMRIIWPPGIAPTNIELRLEGQSRRPITAKRRKGRMVVEERITGLTVGQTVEIAWIW